MLSQRSAPALTYTVSAIAVCKEALASEDPPAPRHYSHGEGRHIKPKHVALTERCTNFSSLV
jgi:hypothetical protein